MGIRKIVQRSAIVQQSVLGVPVKLHPVINIPGEVLKLRVQFQESVHIQKLQSEDLFSCYESEAIILFGYL